MSDRASCEACLALAPEVALGIASGEERAWALEHTATCIDCRRHVDELSQAADELLLLIPPREPAVGFQSRALDRLALRRRTPRWRRVLAVAAALALGAAAGILGSYASTNEQRQSARLYQQALERAGGQYFGAVALENPDGSRGGHVFGYAGSPSWLFVVVEAAHTSGRHVVEVDTRGGARIVLGSLDLTDGQGTFGAALPGRLRDLARLRVVDERGAVALQADFRSG